MGIRHNFRAVVTACALVLAATGHAAGESSDVAAQYWIEGQGTIEVSADASPFGNLIDEFSQRSGIQLSAPDELRHEAVTVHAQAADWDGLARRLLDGYNLVEVKAADGSLEKVFVLARSEAVAEVIADEPVTATPAASVAAAQVNPLTSSVVPEELAALPATSIAPVTLDLGMIKDLEPGSVVKLELPTGSYDVVYDELVEDEDTYSWIGHLVGEDEEHRVILTQGPDGIYGYLRTPEGVQRIETYGTASWIVNFAASGLGVPSYLHDAYALADIPGGLHAEAGLVSDARRATKKKSKKKKRKSKKRRVKATTIDLMVLYTKGVKRKRTRIKHLVNMTNRAFADSKVKIRMRIVHMRQVRYSQSNANGNALDDLTYGRGAFRKVERLRTRYQADLVTLVRPFRYPNQSSCGVAWLAGANGSRLSRGAGYSVVSDGVSNGYYCSDYTLAHELGHNLGSAHDRANAGISGAYSDSYGYGEEGSFGTIMSYLSPEVGRFSSRARKCNGSACGTKRANNAASLNRTRKKVAAYYRGRR